MTKHRFSKTLSSNDVGVTGSHQAGILVPKANPDLLSFFPALDASLKNPDAWIVCADAEGNEWKLRYIYYNNRLHTERGTRNEFRLTHLTAFLRQVSARPGDQLVFTATKKLGHYTISIDRSPRLVAISEKSGVIKLCGWRRIH
jgi:hypothetical protein